MIAAGNESDLCADLVLSVADCPLGLYHYTSVGCLKTQSVAADKVQKQNRNAMGRASTVYV